MESGAENFQMHLQIPITAVDDNVDMKFEDAMEIIGQDKIQEFSESDIEAFNNLCKKIKTKSGPSNITPNERHTSNSKRTKDIAKKEVKNIYECVMCGKISACAPHHEQHFRCHTGEKPFYCPVCMECFRQRGHLIKHICSFHRSEEVMLVKIGEDDIWVKTFKCNFCDFITDTIKKFRTHVSWGHDELLQKQF